MTPRVVLDARGTLGEGPVWDERSGALWWIDIDGRAIHRFEPSSGLDTAWALPEPPGCLALTPGPRLVVALASGLAWFDPASGAVTPFLPIEAGNARTRLNDGRVDHGGRLWVGSMAGDEGGAIGTLYRVDAPATLTAIKTPITVPNCTAFSPDGRTIYWADSPTRRILSADLDPATGAVGDWRLFAEAPRGFPDGGTVDSAGHLWVALWDGSALARYAPDGTLVALVDLPTRRPTCPSFGGPDLRTMYVTSATRGLTDIRPGEGGLLAIDVEVPGLPEARFGA